VGSDAVRLQSGLFVLGSVLVGTGGSELVRCQRLQVALQDLAEAAGFKAFSDVVLAPTVRDGMTNLMLVCLFVFALALTRLTRVESWQSAGLGGMKPNTVVVGWINDDAAPSAAAAAGIPVEARFPLRASRAALSDRLCRCARTWRRSWRPLRPTMRKAVPRRPCVVAQPLDPECSD
jgi:hypothetical protein